MMEKLKQVRESKGITQVRLSEMSGVTQNNISLYENGKKTPKTSTAKKLADALDVNLLDII